jgi:hypothetical protein
MANVSGWIWDRIPQTCERSSTELRFMVVSHGGQGRSVRIHQPGKRERSKVLY